MGYASIVAIFLGLPGVVGPRGHILSIKVDRKIHDLVYHLYNVPQFLLSESNCLIPFFSWWKLSTQIILKILYLSTLSKI